MSHWAEIDDNGIVLRVTKGNDSNGEAAAYNWLVQNLGGTWMQCSYNRNIRKNYPGPGYRYDSGLDAFIAPQPFPSWSLNTSSCQWEAPVPYPRDGRFYIWMEETLSWQQQDVPPGPAAIAPEPDAGLT